MHTHESVTHVLFYVHDRFAKQNLNQPRGAVTKSPEPHSVNSRSPPSLFAPEPSLPQTDARGMYSGGTYLHSAVQKNKLKKRS